MFKNVELGQKVDLSSITNNAEITSSCFYLFTEVNNGKTSLYEYVIYDSEIREITAPSNMFTIVRSRPWYQEMVNFTSYKAKNGYLPLSEKERKELNIVRYQVRGDKVSSVYLMIYITIYFIGVFIFNGKMKNKEKRERFALAIIYIVLFAGLSFLSYYMATIV